jgi:transcriptional regulator NrdR family protein
MIACPKCGAPTRVKETRQTGSYARRRRLCSGLSCNGRVTTVEIPLNASRSAGRPSGDSVIVLRRDLEDLMRIAATLANTTEPLAADEEPDRHETACEEWEEP